MVEAQRLLSVVYQSQLLKFWCALAVEGLWKFFYRLSPLQLDRMSVSQPELAEYQSVVD